MAGRPGRFSMGIGVPWVCLDSDSSDEEKFYMFFSGRWALSRPDSGNLNIPTALRPPWSSPKKGIFRTLLVRGTR